MNYRPVDRNWRPWRRSWSWPVLIILALAIYFLGSSTVGWLYTPVEFVSRPIVWTLSGTGQLLNNLLLFFQTKNSLLRQNNDLKQENLRLRNLFLANRAVEAENVELKGLLGLRDKKHSPLILAVSARPNQTANDILLIDTAGLSKQNSLKVGDKVVGNGGTVLLGEVAATFLNTAKVRLFSAFGEQLAVNVGADHTPAIAIGQGAGNFYLSLPKGMSIKVGDPITASAYHDLLVGSVGAIEVEATSPYIKVLFRSPLNFYELKWVEIYAD